MIRYCCKMSERNGMLLQYSHGKQYRSLLALQEFRQLLTCRNLCTPPSLHARKWAFQLYFGWLVGWFFSSGGWYGRRQTRLIKTLRDTGHARRLIQKGFSVSAFSQLWHSIKSVESICGIKQNVSYTSNSSVATLTTVTLRRLRDRS